MSAAGSCMFTITDLMSPLLLYLGYPATSLHCCNYHLKKKFLVETEVIGLGQEILSEVTWPVLFRKSDQIIITVPSSLKICRSVIPCSE